MTDDEKRQLLKFLRKMSSKKLDAEIRKQKRYFKNYLRKNNTFISLEVQGDIIMSFSNFYEFSFESKKIEIKKDVNLYKDFFTLLEDISFVIRDSKIIMDMYSAKEEVLLQNVC